MQTPRQRDLRVQKTYDALMGALTELLAEKPFDKITVKALCDRARVRTATFYTHFSDKYDFFACMVRERRAASLDPERAARLQDGDFYHTLVRTSLEFLEANEAFIESVGRNDLLGVIVQTTGGEFREELVARLKSDAAAGRCLAGSPELAAELIVGAISRACHWWLSLDERPSVDEMVPQLECFIDRVRGVEPAGMRSSRA